MSDQALIIERVSSLMQILYFICLMIVMGESFPNDHIKVKHKLTLVAQRCYENDFTRYNGSNTTSLHTLSPLSHEVEIK